MTKALNILENVLQDPQNDLVRFARAFRRSGESVWHVDRHVLDVVQPSSAREVRLAACAAGLGLLRKWSVQASAERRAGIKVSEPYLIVDDGWLEGQPDAPPPHIYICLCAGEEDLSVEHEPARWHGHVFPSSLAALLAEDEAYCRVDGAFESEPGAWLVRRKR